MRSSPGSVKGEGGRVCERENVCDRDGDRVRRHRIVAGDPVRIEQTMNRYMRALRQAFLANGLALSFASENSFSNVLTTIQIFF